MSGPSTFKSFFARNCAVRKIPRDRAREFICANHRYGWSECRHCYGLFANERPDDPASGTLVAVSCFSNARRWKRASGEVTVSYEWVRYANLAGTRVVGGMGKSLAAFASQMHPDEVMSYAPVEEDIRNDSSGAQTLPGESYLSLGFFVESIKSFPDGTKSVKYKLLF